MRADLIFVMAEGQVVESGSHDELSAAEAAFTRSPGNGRLSLISINRVVLQLRRAAGW